MDTTNRELLKAIIEKFDIAGNIISIEPYGSGHINDTYLVTARGEGEIRYIFQRMNTTIFLDTKALMENITGVTNYLADKIRKRGGDPLRETLHVIPLKTGENYYSGDSGCYRMYNFVEDAKSFDIVESPEDFYESAVAFGNFQSLLADYPAHTLHETIPDFHNTGKRFKTFLEAVQENNQERMVKAQEEITFVMNHEKDMTILTDMLSRGQLPLRVTHNDTKLNNIMLDNKTHKAICVIDLDTVMPGLSLYDFGDSIRFGANTAAEDEEDASKASLDLNLYELYVKGYIEGCKGSLTETELKMLPMGAKIMTLECGMRFLTDYLQGDVYFKVHKKDHNLIRCRTQFALVADMEKKWSEMEAIVQKYAG